MGQQRKGIWAEKKKVIYLEGEFPGKHFARGSNDSDLVKLNALGGGGWGAGGGGGTLQAAAPLQPL